MPVLRVSLNKLSSDWQVARALLEDEYTSFDKAVNKFRTRYEFAAHLLDVHRMWCVRRALARPGCLPVRSDGDAADAVRSKIYVSASTQTGIKQEDHADESNQEKDKDEQREEGAEDGWLDNGRHSSLQDHIPDTHQHSADVQSLLERTTSVSDLLIKPEVHVVSQEHCDVDMDSSMDESTSHQRHKEGISTHHIESDVGLQSRLERTNPVSDLLIKQERAFHKHCDVDTCMDSSGDESTSQQRCEEGIPTQHMGPDVQSHLERTNPVSDLLIKQEVVSQNCDVDMESSRDESTSQQRHKEGIPTQHIGSDVQSRLERTNPVLDLLIKQEVVSHENCDVDMDSSRDESTSHQRHEEGVPTQHIRSDGKTVMDSNNELSGSTLHNDEHSPEGSSQDLCGADGKTILENFSKPSRSTYDSDERSPEGSSPDLCDADGKTILENFSKPSRSTYNSDKCSPEGSSLDLCDADGKTILENFSKPSRSTYDSDECSPEGSSPDLWDAGISSNKKLQTPFGSARKKPFQCKSCSKIYFSWSAFYLHLKTHMEPQLQSKRTHTRTKPNQCSVCEKGFITKDHLAVHMRTHSGQKLYQCSACNKVFTNSDHLVVHMRTHTEGKPFGCNCCSYRCSRKRYLTLHMRTHTGEKPFECNCCSYRCSQKSCLTLHMRTHTGEKPYQCSVCNKAFTHSGNLSRHIRTHTGEKPF